MAYYITCEISVNQGFTLPVSPLVNSRLLVGKVLGSQKLCVDFQLCPNRDVQGPVCYISLTYAEAKSHSLERTCPTSWTEKT